MSGVRRQAGRWLVGTLGGVQGAGRGWDILVLADGEASAGSEAVETVVGAGFGRVYAFVRPRRRPDRLLDLWLEPSPRPERPRAARPRVPVRVVFVPTPPCAAGRAATPLKWKRQHIWYNAPRNERVAEVARAAAGCDLRALRRLGLGADDTAALA